MNIEDYILEKKHLIDQQMDLLIPERQGPFQKLFQAARYSLLGKGKRIRPILTLATSEIFEANETAALIPACTLEFIHTYSLIHDDLPCMDNDDFRRGQPSLHKVYPEGHALLTGDLLLTFAFETLAKSPFITNDQKIQLIDTLASKSGSNGMIGGQAMDIEAVDKELELDALRHIHELKTGALLTASIEFGGIIGQANDFQMEILKQFGHSIGLAFQIIDDIHDVTFCEQKHGKLISSDVVNKKTTYVTLLGLEKSKLLAVQLYESAISKLNLLKLNTSRLNQLAELIISRQS